MIGELTKARSPLFRTFYATTYNSGFHGSPSTRAKTKKNPIWRSAFFLRPACIDNRVLQFALALMKSAREFCSPQTERDVVQVRGDLGPTVGGSTHVAASPSPVPSRTAPRRMDGSSERAGASHPPPRE